MKKNKKSKSTYEKFILDSTQKKLLDAEYQELLISEMLIAAMDKDNISVRKLAKEAGVSPTIVQGLRSGTKANINYQTLSKIMNAIGYEIAFIPKGHHKRNAA